jgi:hypothetical protein
MNAVIPALRSSGQEDCEFEVVLCFKSCLGYVVKPCLKKKSMKTNKQTKNRKQVNSFM